MDSKLLTEDGWKAIVQKFKIKDNGLQKALVTYEVFDDDAPDDRLKALANVAQLAASLKKVKEVAAIPAAVKYLADMLTAADAEQRELAKLKALAEKTAAAAKKNEDEAKKKGPDADENEEGEEEEGDYAKKLLAAFQKLKGAKDLSYEFIVCDAKPHCGLMIARKIIPKHKEELTKLTGSKRFLHSGTCQFVDGKFDFRMEQTVSGLARKLQDSIKNFTSKKLPIKVGAESVEEEEAKPAAGAAQPAAGAQPPSPALAKAPELWHDTVNAVEASLEQLRTAIRKEFASEGTQLLAEIEQHVNKFDAVLQNLDHSLADALAKARTAATPAARQAELKTARGIYERCIKFVASDPLVVHLDSNPFGVKTELKQKVGSALKQMAPAFA